MRKYFKSIRLALIIVLLLRITNSLNAQDESNRLVLSDQGRTIENQIHLTISNTDYKKIMNSEGVKISLKNPMAVINDDTIDVRDIHLRGQSTLYLRRKSYEIKSGEKMAIIHNGQKKEMKELVAVSLSMDKNYVRNRLSFELMENLGLFQLFYAFTEVRINGQSEGIYMIIEPPTDWALKTQHSPLVIRRGYEHKIEKIKAGKETGKTDEKLYHDYYFNIYQSIGKFEGEELYHRLNEYIDLVMYMRWLAFNFIVRNGDYSDEVFLYIDPVDTRFKVIPWDYDDIFATAPHEGLGQNKQNIAESLIFSSEDELDRKIASDSYLHKMYLEQLKETLNAMTEDDLKAAIENTYAELYPYFSDPEIVGMSRYDIYKHTNLGILASDLNLIYTNLNLTRQTLLKSLQ